MIDEATALAGYRSEVVVDPRTVAKAAARTGVVLVVLDDDPTGTQSIAGLPVLTRWEEADFGWAFGQQAPAVYVLTNTRSLDPASAAERNREIVSNALFAAAVMDTPIAFVSRGDSTLRGHFPLETDVIAETLLERADQKIDGIVIVPAFPDAGRITIGGIHYMRGAAGLTPVADTEFARDATFGYSHSDLREYVEEKTEERILAGEVVLLDLNVIRAGSAAIAAVLAPVRNGTPIVVDAVSENDLRLLSLGLIEAEESGKTFLYRVGPPLVRARIGQEQREPLTSAEIYGPTGSVAVGGLIVVGSHVGVTTRQLAALTATRSLARTLELDIDQIIDPLRAGDHISQIVAGAVAGLAEGDVVIHTSRTLRRSTDPDESLEISRRVSAAVVTTVQLILAAHPPRFVIAKGGITSSDVATHGLGIRRAIVRGPMLPGIVSLWEPVGGPAAGIPYIVFAGNVGDDESLAKVVTTLESPKLIPA